MANPHKGEVAVAIGGQEVKLSLSANALCELEDVLDQNVNQIAESMQDPKRLRMKVVQAAFWASLLDHQPETKIADAKALMAKMKPTELIELVSKVFTLAFPAPEPNVSVSSGGAGGPGDPGGTSPPKPVETAADGTGSAS